MQEVSVEIELPEYMRFYRRLGMEEKVMKLGAIGYLRKPFDEQCPLEAIRRACAKGV